MEKLEGLISTKEAAAYLHMSEKKVRGLFHNGEFRCFRNGNKLLFAVKELDRWIESNLVWATEVTE